MPVNIFSYRWVERHWQEDDDDAPRIDRQSRRSTAAQKASERQSGPATEPSRWMMDHHGYASRTGFPRRASARGTLIARPAGLAFRFHFCRLNVNHSWSRDHTGDKWWRHRVLSCSSQAVTAAAQCRDSCVFCARHAIQFLAWNELLHNSLLQTSTNPDKLTQRLHYINHGGRNEKKNNNNKI